jgi:hypothetical protein
MSYAWEKLNGAVRNLAGIGSQRERLIRAYTYNVIQIREEQVPEGRWERFEKLRVQITRIDAKGGEGNIKATVESIEAHEVDEMVMEIVDLYDDICRHEKPFD